MEQNESLFNGEFIPFNPQLAQVGVSPMSNLLYGWIKFITSNGGKFYFTNHQIGKMFGACDRSASRWVSEL